MGPLEQEHLKSYFCLITHKLQNITHIHTKSLYQEPHINSGLYICCCNLLLLTLSIMPSWFLLRTAPPTRRYYKKM